MYEFAKSGLQQQSANHIKRKWLYKPARVVCNNNQLTTLNVNGCTSLQWLDCYDNRLTALSVSGLTSLQHLDCSFNQHTALDVSGLVNLEDIDCCENGLTELNVRNCRALQRLNCSFNRLAALDASGCTSLQKLYCNNNKLSAEVLKKLFEDFPERKEKCGRVLLYTDGDSKYKDFTQPPELAAAFKAAKAKGWRLYKINNDDLMEL
ncbi:hypothetical protein DWQ65_07500 [Treponema phagedenis]|uniref:Leucine Rich Repeat protein n=1 Tax=Treponema phagedenis TaxID=162 RepID=A0A0B7GPY6_TREPH